MFCIFNLGCHCSIFSPCFGFRHKKKELVAKHCWWDSCSVDIVISTAVRFHLSDNPGFVFRTAFGKLPDNNIKVLEHDCRFSTDYVSVHLKIEASREDFKKILETGFQKKNKD